jgi:hypothetical protein
VRRTVVTSNHQDTLPLLVAQEKVRASSGKLRMNANELADKSTQKLLRLLSNGRQSEIAEEHIQKRAEDIEYCERATFCRLLSN